MDPKLQARIEKNRAEKEELFQNITYGKLPEKVRRIIFEHAWEEGHGSGANEVELYYNDLTELVEKVRDCLCDECCIGSLKKGNGEDTSDLTLLMAKELMS